MCAKKISVNDKIDYDRILKDQAYASEVAIGRLLMGYISSLQDICNNPHVTLKLDRTYETVKNLPVALGWLFFAGMSPNSEYSTETNIEIVEKTLSAYIMLLASNEENCTISAGVRPNFSDDISNPAKWAIFDIKLKSRLVSIDVLNEIHGCTKYENEILTINMDKAINIYKLATGVDLKTYGVDSLEGRRGK